MVITSISPDCITVGRSAKVDVDDLPVVVGGVAEYRRRVGTAVVGPEAAVLAILVDPAPRRQLGVVGAQQLATLAYELQAVAVAGRLGGVLLGSRGTSRHQEPPQSIATVEILWLCLTQTSLWVWFWRRRPHAMECRGSATVGDAIRYLRRSPRQYKTARRRDRAFPAVRDSSVVAFGMGRRVSSIASGLSQHGHRTPPTQAKSVDSSAVRRVPVA